MKQLYFLFYTFCSIVLVCDNRQVPVQSRNNPFDAGGVNFVYRNSAAIYESGGTAPAAGAVVSLFYEAFTDTVPLFIDTTNNKGEFSIAGVPEGTYLLTARKDSDILYYDSLVIASDYTTLRDDTLEHPSLLYARIPPELRNGCDYLHLQFPAMEKMTVPLDTSDYIAVDGLVRGNWPVFISCDYFFSAEAPVIVSLSHKDTAAMVADTADTSNNPSSSDTSDTRIHPGIGYYYVYYGSLHNHSLLSDGSGDPRDAYEYARKEAKLDFFSLSDHAYYLNDEAWNYTRTIADSFNVNDTFVTLWGFEWTSGPWGHITVTATENYVSSNDPLADSFDKLCDWLILHDALAVYNHPYPSTLMYQVYEHPPIENLVGMELWNKTYDFSVYYYNDGYYANDNQKGFFDELLSLEWKLGATGADDNHMSSWGTRSDYRMAILATRLTRKDLLSAIRARRFYSTLDKNIVLSFSTAGNEMGSTVTGKLHRFRIQAYDGNDEPFSRIVVYNSDRDSVYNKEMLDGMIDISFDITVDQSDYFYMKISQPDGDEAISSPIWVIPSE